MITQEQLKRILNLKADALLQWYAPMNDIFKKYEINTPKRMAAFLSQTGHESNNFTALVENLNYSASGLTTTFKKYFPTIADTLGYERNPIAIASKVYANRMGNGDEKSRDGWKYRGRGLIQITGHDNYQKFSKAINISIDDVIPYMETKEGALESAAWYWSTNALNRFADVDDVKGITRRINGGEIGLVDRQARYDNALSILS